MARAAKKKAPEACGQVDCTPFFVSQGRKELGRRPLGVSFLGSGVLFPLQIVDS